MNSSTPTTIKDRLLAAMRDEADTRGRVALSPEALGKRFGLNGHDLAKNLDQLRKEGFIYNPWQRAGVLGRLRVRLGPINYAALDTERLSVPDRVERYLTQRIEPGMWIEITPDQVREALGVPVGNGTVASGISNLQRMGRVEVRKTGRRITAMRVVRVEPPLMSTTVTVEGPIEILPYTDVEIPPTPHLDKYISARRMAILAPSDNPYLELTFHRDPIAEEAVELLKVLRTSLAKENSTP